MAVRNTAVQHAQTQSLSRNSIVSQIHPSKRSQILTKSILSFFVRSADEVVFRDISADVLHAFISPIRSTGLGKRNAITFSISLTPGVFV
jgi:hypothetical protein